MNRFDEVARLMELENTEDGDWSYTTRENGDGIAHIWGSDGDEVAEVYDNPGLDISEEVRAQFILSAKDDLPWLLEVAACFRQGDAERIRTVLLALNDPMWASCVEVLTRHQKAAAIMEGQE